MSLELKAKQVRNTYSNVIKLGYCELQELFSKSERIGYTCGVYGWNSDIFHIDNKTALCTGYRAFGNISPSYEIRKNFEEKIKEASSLPWEHRQTAYEGLKVAFIETCLKEVV